MEPRVELPPLTKHIIVLLDIDKTLVAFRDYAPAEMITYTGGHHTWVACLRKFKETAKAQGIEVHYGIATLKKRNRTDNANLIGDIIYAQIMADQYWQLITKCSYSNHLKEFIDPKLIFFLGEKLEELSKNVKPAHLAALQNNNAPPGYPPVIVANEITYLKEEFFQCKALYAMEEARQIIEKEFGTFILKEQVYLIDDNVRICHAAIKLDYSSICVDNFVANPEAKQQEVIHKIFDLLVEQLYKVGTPRDPQTITTVNKVILNTLQTSVTVSELLAILTADLPNQLIKPGFFKAAPDEKNSNLASDQSQNDEKSDKTSSSSLSYGSSSSGTG